MKISPSRPIFRELHLKPKNKGVIFMSPRVKGVNEGEKGQAAGWKTTAKYRNNLQNEANNNKLYVLTRHRLYQNFLIQMYQSFPHRHIRSTSHANPCKQY